MMVKLEEKDAFATLDEKKVEIPLYTKDGRRLPEGTERPASAERPRSGGRRRPPPQLHEQKTTMQMQAAEKFAKKREQVRLAAQEMGRKAKEKEAALEKARADRACAHYVRKTVARAISLAVGKAAVRLTWQEAEARKQKFVQLVEPEEEAEAEAPFYTATIDVTEDGTYVVTTEPPAALTAAPLHFCRRAGVDARQFGRAG